MVRSTGMDTALLAELRPGRAELVVGPRQAGKSTWIREILTHFEGPVLVLHAEEPRIRELAQSPALDELAKRLELLDEVLFWRSKSGAEVDFVVRREGRMVAIEVKAAELVRPSVSRGTHSFLEAYRPSCLGVVNASLRLDTIEKGIPPSLCAALGDRCGPRRSRSARMRRRVPSGRSRGPPET